MTHDLRTEDDIARLFAEANPVPTRRSLGDTGDHPTAVEARRDVTIELDEPVAPAAIPERRHPWWLLGAAAVVLASIGAVAVIASNEDPATTGSATTGPNLTTPDTLAPRSTSLDVVDEFFSAVGAYDVGAAARALTPGTVPILVPGAGAGQRDDGVPAALDAQLSWLQAFGWRWEIESCRETGDSGAYCELTTHNRLTDQAPGTGMSTTALFGFDGALIDQLAISTQSTEYGTDIFMPYYAWVTEHHPDDVARLWIPRGNAVPPVRGLVPILTQDAAELMDRRLTEYLAISAGDTRILRRYATAE